MNEENPFEPPEIDNLTIDEDDYQLTFIDKALSVIMCLMIGVVLSPISYLICKVGLERFLWKAFEGQSGAAYKYLHIMIAGIHVFMGIYFIPHRLYRYVTKKPE